MMIMTKTKFYKRVSIKRLFLLGLVISLSSIYLVGILIKVAFAQDINLCLDGTPDVNNLYQDGYLSPNIVWYISNPSRINDDNIDTWQGVLAEGELWRGSAWVKHRYEAIVTFPENAIVVNKVEYVRDGYAATSLQGYYEKTFLYYNSQWNEIYSRGFYVGGKAVQEITSGGPWYNVTRVKVEIYGYSTASGDHLYLNSRLYELRAFGLVYEDIGLRVFDGTQTVSIAVEPLGTLTSPLRIAKDGLVYGIVLVDQGDPNESGIRINTSSGIKALRKYP